MNQESGKIGKVSAQCLFSCIPVFVIFLCLS